jgi:hypothetical protein
MATVASLDTNRSAVAPERSQAGRRWVLGTGLAFIVGAVLVNIPYSLLIAGFDYPDILRLPTGEILNRFFEGGNGLILTWLAFAWSGFPILIAMLLLRRILEEDRHPLAGAATTVGVIGAVAQMVGLLRWSFVVPGIATAHTAVGATEAAKSAAEVTFDAIHRFGGVLLGEHLGQAFTIVWIVMVSGMMFRSRVFRPWLGWVGLLAAAVYSLSQLELIGTVIPGFPNWEAAGLLGSLLWLLWMIVLGVQLATASRRPSVEKA